MAHKPNKLTLLGTELGLASGRVGGAQGAWLREPQVQPREVGGNGQEPSKLGDPRRSRWVATRPSLAPSAQRPARASTHLAQALAPARPQSAPPTAGRAVSPDYRASPPRGLRSAPPGPRPPGPRASAPPRTCGPWQGSAPRAPRCFCGWGARRGSETAAPAARGGGELAPSKPQASCSPRQRAGKEGDGSKVRRAEGGVSLARSQRPAS